MNRNIFTYVSILFFLLSHCSKIFNPNATRGTSSITGTGYSLSVNVNGLLNPDFVVKDTTSDQQITVSSDGTVSFANKFTNGATYSLVVSNQPNGQICSIIGRSGTISADTEIKIKCGGQGPYSIGGRVSGLTGTVVLQNVGDNNLSIASNGAFNFTLTHKTRARYVATVLNHPDGQTCTITNPRGTVAAANVTNILVSCATIPVGNYIIGGTVSGLNGAGLTLQNNLGDSTLIGSNGSFIFNTSVADLSSYAITISRHPTNAWQRCVVNNAVGTISGANVTDVQVICTSDQYSVGGSVTGLTSGSVDLLLAYSGTSQTLNIDAGSTTYNFISNLNSGTDFTVAVTSSPSGFSCALINNAQRVRGANITNVNLTCLRDVRRLAGTVSGMQGSGLQLQETAVASETLSINTNGIFQFSHNYYDGNNPTVSVLTNPTNPTQTCHVTTPTTLFAGSDIDDVSITCDAPPTYSINVNQSGLAAGESVDLTLAAQGNTFPLTVTGGPSTTSTFGNTFLSGENYLVNILNTASAGGKTCALSNQVGTITSGNVTVNLSCSVAVADIEVTVNQSGSTRTGTVYARLYSNHTDALNHAAELTDSSTASGSAVTNLLLTFTNLPNNGATYTVRVFRDASGGNSSLTPDGEPTIGTDDQSSAANVVVGSSVTVDLVSTATLGKYENFNAYSLHDTFEKLPPKGNSGSGFCGGFYMRLEATRSGTNVSAPRVSMPNGSTVTLVDDGGCDFSIANNSSFGYDSNANDNNFSYGVDEPTSSYAGDYTFFFRTTGFQNMIHIQKDNVSSIVKIKRNALLSGAGPTGKNHATSLTPTLEITNVPGAASYYVNVTDALIATNYSKGNYVAANVGATTTSFSIAAVDSITDDRAYQVSVQIFDTDQTVANTDFDAKANSINSYFVADTDNASTITISGSLTNNTSLKGSELFSFMATGTGASRGNTQASFFLPNNATSYSLTVLRDTRQNNGARIQYFLDGIVFNDNGAYYKSKADLNGMANITYNIVLNQNVNALSPTDGQASLGNTPKLAWESYTDTASNASTNLPPTWSYLVLYYNPAPNGGGTGHNFWGLPNTATSLDLASLPGSQNLVDINCINDPSARWDGTTNTCQFGTGAAQTLAGKGKWSWQVIVVECDYDDYVNLTDSNFNGINDYYDCITALVQSNYSDRGFAYSQDTPFSTF